MRMKYIQSGIIFMCLVFFSCERSTTENPEIKLLEPSEDYYDVRHQFNLTIELSDDVALQTYYLSIESGNGFLIFEDSGDLTGHSHILDYNLDISNLEADEMQVNVHTTDEEGNNCLMKKVFIREA